MWDENSEKWQSDMMYTNLFEYIHLHDKNEKCIINYFLRN